jgi:uncharacterized protein
VKLAGEHVFEASPQEVWDALFDPDVLAAAMPGCEKLELVDGVFVGDMSVKVGPINGKFSGKVQLADREPPVRYRMIVDGKGPHGFVKANATIELAAEGERTRMRYDADAQVGGKIATVGQRLIETSAKAITKQSLEGLHENIKIRAAAHRAAREELAALEPPARDEAVDEPEPTAQAVAAPVSVSEAEPVSEPEPQPVSGPVSVSEPGPVSEPASVSKPGPVSEPVSVSEPASEPDAVAKPAAPSLPATRKLPTLAPQYQRADAGKLAATVSKAVIRDLAPWILVVLLSIALVISLVTR